MKWTEYNFRTGMLPMVLAAAVLVLLARLFFLQIVRGGEYRSLADNNRIKEEVIHAPRGIIYDRNNYPLTRNIPGFRTKEDGKVKVLKREEALKLETAGRKEDLEIDSLREYLYPEDFAHALGYLGEVSTDEIATPKGNYKMGDLIGKTGLEKEYENILRGTDGKTLIEVDASLAKLRVLGETKAKPGQDLKTTLDLSLQRKAFEALKNVEKGTVLASDPRTGEILALISKPSFDPNLFTLGTKVSKVDGQSYENAQQILADEENKPLFNRAISGTYPPGSTFKIITAAAGLEEGEITKDTKIEDVGILQVGRFSFPNWYFTQYGKLEGLLDIIGALRRSNDIFFYKVAEMVGLEKLGKMAKNFGLGSALGIDLEGEASGLFPSGEWKEKNVGDKWYLGDTYHLGIGQGYLLTTPLQVNSWTSVIANNGTLCQPTIVKSEKCKVKSQNFLKKGTVELIKEGMRQACSSGGTGWPLFKFQISNFKFQIDNRNFFLPVEATESGKVHIPVACKTGTAEYGDSMGRTHAWFTVFAPVEDPQIVVTVLVEGGGEGSNVAAPIAKQILEEWFGR